MTNIEIVQTIANETQGLSVKALREILNFIQFIKMKEKQDRKAHSLAKYDIDSDEVHL